MRVVWRHSNESGCHFARWPTIRGFSGGKSEKTISAGGSDSGTVAAGQHRQVELPAFDKLFGKTGTSQPGRSLRKPLRNSAGSISRSTASSSIPREP